MTLLSVMVQLLGAGGLGQVDVVAGSGIWQMSDMGGARSDSNVATMRVVGLVGERQHEPSVAARNNMSSTL